MAVKMITHLSGKKNALVIAWWSVCRKGKSIIPVTLSGILWKKMDIWKKIILRFTVNLSDLHFVYSMEKLILIALGKFFAP